ncbi:MAG: hypothetical protein FJZ43_04845 [Candidatus Staskawiczbacteria bacterium]|nr:hypothetical protein [Candidatus Staskawiczbacteria bacterium]
MLIIQGAVKLSLNDTPNEEYHPINPHRPFEIVKSLTNDADDLSWDVFYADSNEEDLRFVATDENHAKFLADYINDLHEYKYPHEPITKKQTNYYGVTTVSKDCYLCGFIDYYIICPRCGWEFDDPDEFGICPNCSHNLPTGKAGKDNDG